MNEVRERRIACVDALALSLQLVMRAHPEWSEDPIVVVEDDRPLAGIVWANRAARQLRIHRGMSFSQAKALSSKLHAEVVAEHDVHAAIDDLFERLLTFSPHVEPVLVQPGLFWLDPNGLDGVFGTLERWAWSVCEALREQRFIASIVVGFARGNALALSRIGESVIVARDAQHERTLAARVPLGRLELSPKLVAELARLGVHTVGELTALPVAQLRVRYGAEAARLHDFLSGKTWSPLLPRTPVEPLVLELEVDPPDDNHGRLLFGLKGLLHGATERLVSEQHAITALELTLELERHAAHHERIETAAPTLDVVQLVDLARLRFGSVALPSKVEHLRVQVEHVRVHARQVALLTAAACAGSRAPSVQRDLEAAARALARVRASFGPDSVVRAELRDAYLPEARYHFVPTTEVALPHVAERKPGSDVPLVRRVLTMPQPLAAPPEALRPRRNDDDAETWLGPHGAVVSMQGPDRIAGGWWNKPVERDYYFVETKTGEIVWVFYDRVRKRWLLHGLLD